VSSPTADRAVERPARWPWVVLALFAAIALVGLWTAAANGESVAGQVPYVIAFTMFGVVGALIVSRDRRNVIGLMLLWSAVFTASSFAGQELATRFIVAGREGPLVVALALLGNLGWAVGILPVLFLLPLLFPDGRLLSPRWRPLFRFIVAFLVLVGLSLLLGQETLTGSQDSVTVPNPFYVGVTVNLDAVINVLFVVLFALGVLSVFMRFRRASGLVRQQIKWVVFGLLAAFVGILVSDFVKDPIANALIGGTAFLAFPVSIGVAVLRFRLYELDVVVKKAVVYAALALFATLVYLGLVVGVGAWLGRGSSFLTMVAAVVVAVTFQPIRARLGRLANRLVYGSRATPYEVLSDFSARVGDAYADEDVLQRMARILGEGIGAERTDVWLAVGRELHDVAVWPSDAAAAASILLSGDRMPPIGDTDRAYPVEQAGEFLGALAVRKPASDPVSPADEKLIAGLAGQAGLVLRNVRLTEELKLHLEDLKAAQKRLVTAQDEERRRLERNIHDGAQQQLVALSVKARLARSVSERDPGRAAEMLEQIERETQTALEDLRDLARGIYPPLLADKGLPAAIDAQARRSSVPVDVSPDGVGRYPQEVESAVYFSCLEALQNVAKYARASRAAVRLGESGGALVFEVADDGTGFDPATAAHGTGLQGIADRIAALEGTLEVRSAPGEGTTVVGRVPLSTEER
jgi:signal transduction histidine kinase